MSDFLNKYKQNAKKRLELGVEPLILDKEEVEILCNDLKKNDENFEELKEILATRVGVGVDEGAKVKSEFLEDIIFDRVKCDGISKKEAILWLKKMLGGYNVFTLLKIFQNDNIMKDLGEDVVNALSDIIFVYDGFDEIVKMHQNGNKYATKVLENWANATWFLKRKKLCGQIKCVCFRVDGETNTDDLSPASEAFTRSDIPLHAQAMLKYKNPDALNVLKQLKFSNLPIAYVGDVVGTGSSRKSAINSLQWHIGEPIDGIANKKTGGIIIGSVIAPIFYNTAQDSGALPIIADVSNLKMGDEIIIDIDNGKILKNDVQISIFALNPNTLADEVRAGGRIPLIVGRGLCVKARAVLNMDEDDIFARAKQPQNSPKGYTQAQKILGKACGLKGVVPGMYIEPKVATVGSQDTTGPMTKDEIKELASLGFNADFVLQSFCHTAAYPKPSDVKMHETLPSFMSSRGGVSLRVGDGVIHSWLNRFCLPDTVGTGGDSHTRFPIGISFPAGSGLVAFAAVTGAMPLNVPKSVLVRFSGKLQPGITLRDLVNAIPLEAIKQGLLTVEKRGKKNIFAGKILEIEGLDNLSVEQAFELSDASAERSAAACSISLNVEQVSKYLRSNINLINHMIKEGYEDAKTLERRAKAMEEWLKNPTLLKADENAEYEHIFEIDLNKIKEPILACPNDPDDVATLSDILADENRKKNIDEVFIGSCMTNIGHYRAAGEILKNAGLLSTRLWIAPPTKMDKNQLTKEGYYAIFGSVGARIEVPGCSLCMGNQARVNDGAVVFSTSTRNFDNRMGMGAKVYLGSAELAAVCAMLGRLPNVDEYLAYVNERLDGKKSQIYKYLEF